MIETWDQLVRDERRDVTGCDVKCKSCEQLQREDRRSSKEMAKRGKG
jgi:hypothetical protein